MIEEKLNRIIKKYDVYKKAGVSVPSYISNNWKAKLNLAWGLLRLALVLNNVFGRISDENIAIFATKGKLRTVIWNLLLSENRKKIQFLVSISGDEFHDRTVLENRELNEYGIQTVFTVDWDRGGYANLIGQGFNGNIVDLCSLIYENGLENYFSENLVQNPYVEIFIAKRMREKSHDANERQIWNQRIIAYYLQARDFLNTKQEILDYIRAGYGDSQNYSAFLDELEHFLQEIKRRLEERKQRDIFIHWVDQLEKDDFFSMQWMGNIENCVFFHNAYTTMTNTTPIAKSIFTGQNVKAGNLKILGKMCAENSVFLRVHQNEHNVQFFTRCNLRKYIESRFVHDYHRNLSQHMPSMMGLWEAIDTVLTSSKPCLFFLHCMETHDPYCSGEVDAWHLSSGARGSFQFERDYTQTAKASRDYLDKQLAWYYGFYPLNAISIYMSDHGNEKNLSRQNVNMPFKIMGMGEKSECRLFSYKNLYQLLDCIYRKDKIGYDGCFSDYVVIDSIDPYNRGFMQTIKTEEWKHFMLTRKNIGKESLKKYLQATKIITKDGETYIINILGEESYYLDKGCQIDLSRNPKYARRIAEFRETAGFFYSPWKENRQVAIDFYKSIGIEEKDISSQCY